MSAKHEIRRVRRETRRRRATVAQTSMLTPRMKRIVFRSDEFGDFESASPDDHVKLFVPGTEDASGKPASRDYTPRAFDRAAGTLTIDFVLHDAGSATSWAAAAAPGDEILIGGPRGSAIVPDDFDWYLLIGDETALPAIARRLEELRAGVPVRCILLAEDARDRVELKTDTVLSEHWLFREGDPEPDAERVCAAIAAETRPGGEGFVFIAAEANTAQAIKREILASGHNSAWLKASGYWIKD